MTLKDLLPTGRWEREEKARKKVMIGAAVGLTAGAVAGVLLAPKAGKETRSELKKKVQELPDKVQELSEKAQVIMGEVKGKITEATQKAVSGMEEQAAEIKDEIREDERFQKLAEVTEEQVDAFKKKLKK